ncbi:MAG: heat-inducible transcriptional repressor HrcA [Oscillospiraceae bacterium]|jgi:heat-inducible transcriptional repressor|nr:heat-inducible transcriptional repressor HrcA [Oscillospiraceae bacterium]
MTPGQRKYKILQTIIESYVESGDPVGSKTLAAMLENAVSSATIRNDMSDLVDSGYLEQPHTSSGRIPSQRGYRLYVDQLMWKRTLTDEVQSLISDKLTAYSCNPERFIEAAAQLLSEQTNFVAVITTPADVQARVVAVEIMPTSEHTVVIMMMISPSVLKSRICRLHVKVESAAVNMLRHYMNLHLLNMQISELTDDYMERITNELGSVGTALAPAFAMAADIAQEAGTVQIAVEGQSNLYDREDLSYSDVKELMAFLRNKQDIINLLSLSGSSHVIIGRESKKAQLSGVSVVAARYYSGIGASGLVGVIGPLRMNYSKLIPYVEYFAGVVGSEMKATLGMY